MRLSLPFVFEMDVFLHEGRRVREKNYRSYVDVDVTEVDDIDYRNGVGWGHVQFALWNGVLIQPWLKIGSGGNLSLRDRLNEIVRVHRDRGTRPDAGVGPAYMRSRRLGYIRNALDPEFPDYDGVPLNVVRVVRSTEDERRSEAQLHYARSLVFCRGYLFERIPEPVWHIRKLPGSASGYILEPAVPANFLTSYREFRIDRYDEASEFINRWLHAGFDEHEHQLHHGQFQPARSDIVELCYSTIASINNPAVGDANLSLLHRENRTHRDLEQAVGDGRDRVRTMIKKFPRGAQMPRMRILAARWDFEIGRSWPPPDDDPDLAVLGF